MNDGESQQGRRLCKCGHYRVSHDDQTGHHECYGHVGEARCTCLFYKPSKSSRNSEQCNSFIRTDEGVVSCNEDITPGVECPNQADHIRSEVAS